MYILKIGKMARQVRTETRRTVALQFAVIVFAGMLGCARGFSTYHRKNRIKEREHRELSHLHLHAPIHTRWRDHEYEEHCDVAFDRVAFAALRLGVLSKERRFVVLLELRLLLPHLLAFVEQEKHRRQDLKSQIVFFGG